jgi:hypothetical protein
MREPDPKSLPERLLAQEAVTPSLRQRYEQEIRNLLEKRFTPYQRACGWLSVATFLFFAVGLGARALGLGEPLNLPPDLWVLLGVSMAGWLALEVWFVYALLRPTLHRTREEPWGEAVGGVAAGAFAAVLLWLAGRVEDLATSLQVTAVALVLFGYLGVTALLYFQRRQHRETQVKLLELELRLAELAEKRERHGGPPGAQG